MGVSFQVDISLHKLRRHYSKGKGEGAWVRRDEQKVRPLLAVTTYCVGSSIPRMSKSDTAFGGGEMTGTRMV
jgi:hypothetical protein